MQNISDTNRWKGTPAPGLGHTLLLNVPLPRVMARFSALPIKIPMVPGTQMASPLVEAQKQKNHPKIHMGSQGLPDSHSSIDKGGQSWRSHFLISKM